MIFIHEAATLRNQPYGQLKCSGQGGREVSMKRGALTVLRSRPDSPRLSSMSP
jgi:hypothetical protein